ncbi:MAG: ABC transporter ATP-binding protein [Bacteroidota bacterium]
MNTVVAENISKSYNKIPALNNINFSVDKGEIFGFIGPDGAGKTSLFRILVTLLLPDEGKASVVGLDVVKDYKKIRKQVGYMPGKFSLYQDLTVEENLTFFATIFSTTIEENYHLIKDIYSQIEPFKDRRAGALSGGMKQKLALSCALIHKPEVLFLDEPTTGVDAVSRKEFWEMLKSLKSAGITIVVSTPYMDEASLCDRVALIQNGNILKIDKPEMITANFGKKLLALRSSNIHKLLSDLGNYQYCDSVFPFGQYVHYTAKENQMNEGELEKYLLSSGHEHLEMKMIEPNIEDCFMSLMNQTA